MLQSKLDWHFIQGRIFKKYSLSLHVPETTRKNSCKMGADVVEDWKVVSVLINLQRKPFKIIYTTAWNCLTWSWTWLS